ncbi:dual specificity protein phosphatase 3-like isoform X2 [Tachypleus tridentatus]
MTTSWWRQRPSLCTPDELKEIITAPSGGYYALPTDPYNEVYPNVYISDGTTALCTCVLRRLRVTYVLNAAQGKDKWYNLINTSPAFYKDTGIEYMGVEAIDMSSFNLEPYFQEAADFIEKGLDSGGKVLVHCRQGISRSATLVLAFLMIKRHLTAQEAMRTVRSKREIIPNDGFLKQLCLLNDKLTKERRINSFISY